MHQIFIIKTVSSHFLKSIMLRFEYDLSTKGGHLNIGSPVGGAI